MTEQSWHTRELWRVERHGGGPHDYWRIVFQGTEKDARQRFDKISSLMRQGGTRLVRPDGSVETEAEAPRRK